MHCKEVDKMSRVEIEKMVYKDFKNSIYRPSPDKKPIVQAYCTENASPLRKSQLTK